MANDVQLAVWIDKTTKDRLDSLRENYGVSVAFFVRQAIDERLDVYEQTLAKLPEKRPAE